MLSWGETAVGPGPDRANPARSQETYQRYAVVLYRQALLNLDDPASAGHGASDALVNEYALAAMAERGEDDARYRLAESVFRRFRQLAAGSAALLQAVLRKGAAGHAAVRGDEKDLTRVGRSRVTSSAACLPGHSGRAER
jgi:hypothetical protein